MLTFGSCWCCPLCMYWFMKDCPFGCCCCSTPNDGGAMFVLKLFSVTVAPICAAFCSSAVADMCGDPAARWGPFSSNMFELSWRDGEEVDERLLENTVPAMAVLLLKGFGAGIGISSCGSDSGCFCSPRLNSEVPPICCGLGTTLVLIGNEETRFGIC